MKEAIANLTNFMKNDFFTNLPYYMLQVFLLVLVVLIFAGINIVVRFVTDPICYKVLRMKENKSGAGAVAFVLAVFITLFLLVVANNSLPQLRPTVIGWAGHNIQKVLTSDKMPDLKTDIKTKMPNADDVKGVLPSLNSDPDKKKAPLPNSEPPTDKAPSPPAPQGP